MIAEGSVVEMLVDFFIAGVQKGGTTALDSYLRSHPQIQMAATKEVHYFDDEAVDWASPDRSRLEAQFDWSATSVVRGEATPIYIYWPDALKRLARYNPTAKLVIGLRQPSYRAFSHWKMERERGIETLSFEGAVSPEGRRRVRTAPRGAHRIFSYVERGLYAGQIANLLTLFPRGQVYFFRTDVLWREHERVLREVQSFLSVDQYIDQNRRYVVPVDTSGQDTLSGPIRARLDGLFAEDIQETAALTGLHLADWMSPSYQEVIGP